VKNVRQLLKKRNVEGLSGKNVRVSAEKGKKTSEKNPKNKGGG